MSEQEEQPYDRWSRPAALSRRGYVLVALVPVLIAAVAFGAIVLFASDEPELRGTTVQLPTSDWKPGDGGDDALIQGVVEMDEDHCVYLESGGDAVYAVWPAGWKAAREGDFLTLYDADGGAVAHNGDQISVGGGFHPVQNYAGEMCLPDDGDVAVVQGDIIVGQ